MASQLKPAFAPVVVPQGGGTFLVRPGKPVLKLSLKAAAQITGLSRATVYRLYNAGFLKGERPSQRKIFVFADSLDEYLQRCREDKFWEDSAARQKFRESLRAKRPKWSGSLGHTPC